MIMDNFIEIILFILSCFITITTFFCVSKFILPKDKNNENFYDHIIFGIIFTSFFSLMINFIFPLNKEINTIFQIFVISIFFIFFKNNISFKYIKSIFIISLLIVLIISFDTENRPDAYLYHLPYVQILNENKIIPGLANLHLRFAHISIFQYLSSFNYTIISGLNGLIIPSVTYCLVIFLYFLNEILNLSKDKISAGKLFSLLIFTYICLRINRYSEFGNDAMAHLTVFYLTSKFIYLDSKKISSYKKILLLCVFSFLNKPFLIFSFILPIYLFFKNKMKIKSGLINLPVMLLFFWIVKNILISGCILYPIEKTCFSHLKLIDTKEINAQKIAGEAWAKAWPDRENKNITQEEFITKFNWLNAWQKKHQKIFLKNLLPYILLVIFMWVYLRGKNEIKHILERQKIIILLLFSTIGTCYFFLKFPLYRYGYSYLIILISIFFLACFKRINIEKLFKVLRPFTIVLLIALLTKQSVRIVKYYDERTLIPSDKYLSLDNKKKVREIKISKNFSYYLSEVECKYFKAPCTNVDINNIKHKKFLGYDIIYKDL